VTPTTTRGRRSGRLKVQLALSFRSPLLAMTHCHLKKKRHRQIVDFNFISVFLDVILSSSRFYLSFLLL